MTVKEAAKSLGWKKDSVIAAINEGVELPKSKQKIKLAASGYKSECEVTDDALDDFLSKFEAEEPGRHPPIGVRRELRTEARHKCGICHADLPVQFHHIFPWCDLKHHDPKHMIAICGGCHDKIEQGLIDRQEQIRYKRRLVDMYQRLTVTAEDFFSCEAVAAIPWNDLKDVISAIHAIIIDDAHTAMSKFDFEIVDIEVKNELNSLGADYFEVMKDDDEPYFGRIKEFLESPANKKVTECYFEVVDELRRRIAANQDKASRFEDILLKIHVLAKSQFGEKLGRKGIALRKLISFMYFNCDIGRKHAKT